MLPEPGGYEIDVQRRLTSGDTPQRQVHLLSVTDGAIDRHVVYPALPREPFRLPAKGGTLLRADSCTAFRHQGLSGAELFRARLETGEPVVVKHVRPARDWMARATRDPGREAVLFTEGVYQRLPPRLTSPVIAADPVEDGWLIVMRDVREALEALPSPGDEATWERLLTAVHAMHQGWADRQPPSALCTLEDRLRLFSPLRPLIERHGSDTLPKTLSTSWECFADHADPDVASVVLRLVQDPSELLRALRAAAPSTFLHGDYRPANLGLAGDTVVALDWGLACFGPPELDFVWFLSNTAWEDEAACDRLESLWQRVARREPRSPVVDLAVVYHAVMGEVAFLLAQSLHQPDGFPRPSATTVRWWLRRVADALQRLGDLSAPPRSTPPRSTEQGSPC